MTVIFIIIIILFVIGRTSGSKHKPQGKRGTQKKANKAHTNGYVIYQQPQPKSSTTISSKLQHSEDYRYWKLGNKYESILNLKFDEVQFLNKVGYHSNVFFDVEQNSIEIIKLYLSALKNLQEQYIKEGTNLYKEFALFKSDEIYSAIFRFCENVVRENVGNKRKIKTVISIQGSIEETAETKIIDKVSTIIPSLKDNYSKHDETAKIKQVENSESKKANEHLIAIINTIIVSHPNNEVIDITGQTEKLSYPIQNTLSTESNRVIENEQLYVSKHPISPANNSQSTYEENYKLGTKYKNKLGLNSQETAWLNKFYIPDNVFLSIEGCCVATIKLYLIINTSVIF